MRIIYFTICAIINIICLLFAIYTRNFTKGTQNKIFLTFSWVVLVNSIFDFLCSFLQLYIEPSKIYEIFLMIFTEFYFVFRLATSLIYCVFTLFITNSFFKRTIKPIAVFLFLLPAIVDTIVFIINPFYPILFYFKDGIYTRLNGSYINYVISTAYMIFGLAIAIKNAKFFSKSKKLALYAMYFLIFLSVVIQAIKGNLLIEMYATSVGLFVTMLLIQRPDEYTDSTVGTENYFGFSTQTNVIFYQKIPANFIIIKNLDDEVLSKGTDYNNYMRVQKYLARQLYSIMNKYRITSDLFYIGRGRFVILTRGEKREVSREIAEDIFYSMKKLNNENTMNFEIKFAICHAKVTNNSETSDVKTKNSLFNLIETFHKFSWDFNEILYLDKARNRRLFGPYIEIEEILKRALENNKIEVYYQPIYSTTEKCINSCEALLRLNDEDFGFVSPEIFIPASEKNGMIIQLGDFVFESVCKFVASDDFKKLNLDYVEVNLSIYQCMQSDLVNKIQNCINKYKISTNYINFEITETMSEQGSIILKNISKLSELGFKFSLDDYGTGYSNIKRIITLPLNIIKFDKTFVRESKNPQMKIIIENSIDMIKQMNKKVVIEGVETEDMLKTFTDFDVDFIQGYYFSKPLPKDEFCNYLLNFVSEAGVAGGV